MRKQIEHIPDEVMTALVRYDWPGNVRELQNFIERSVILTRGAELRAPIAELTNQKAPNWVLRTLADAERAHIIATLQKTNWVVGGKSGAASRLGLNRTTLIAKMRRLGISRETVEQRARLSNSYANAPLKGLSVPAPSVSEAALCSRSCIGRSDLWQAAQSCVQISAN